MRALRRYSWYLQHTKTQLKHLWSFPDTQPKDIIFDQYSGIGWITGFVLNTEVSLIQRFPYFNTKYQKGLEHMPCNREASLTNYMHSNST